MSRDIMFRAWDLSKLRFVIETDMVHIALNGDISHCSDAGITNRDDLILMQYTGLKDKNGVEIYEGDIVRDVKTIDDPETKGRSTWLVVYDAEIIGYVGSPTAGKRRGHWVVQMDPSVENRESVVEHDGRYLLWEVIGNIHETPELLEPQS